MGRADEEVLDEVAVLHVHAGDAAAAAVLLAVGVERQRLDVAGVRDRDHHLLVGDQVLDVDLALGVGDLGAALVAEALGDLAQLLLDDREHAQLVAEDRAQLGDPLDDVGVLAPDLVGLERGQLGEAQVEDRRGLDHAGSANARRAAARASRSRDARIRAMIRRGCSSAISSPSEHVGAGFALGELVLGAADDHLALVVDVVADHLPQRERARDAGREPPCSRRTSSAARVCL